MPEEAVTVPATGFGVHIGGGHAMRQREQQRHGVFGGADGVLVRCIGDENAGFGSGFDVDIVESGARPRNNEQLPRNTSRVTRVWLRTINALALRMRSASSSGFFQSSGRCTTLNRAESRSTAAPVMLSEIKISRMCLCIQSA